MAERIPDAALVQDVPVGLIPKAHVWTLPLAPGRWGYLQLPSRNITESEWEQMYALLEAFKPGLLLPAIEGEVDRLAA